MDKSGWDSSVNKVQGDEKKLKGFSERSSANFKKMGMAMTVAGGAIVAGLGAAIKKFVDTGDEIDKMSKRTGIGATALSELGFAADISGTSLGTVEKGVKKMSKTILDANDGLATYVRAFDRIGLSAEALMDLSPEEQFTRIGEAIAGLSSETEKAATAQEIFGRAGTMLLPMFKEGEEGIRALRLEAHELGIVFDTEAAAKAAKLKDEQTRLKGALQGVAFELAEGLIPAVTDLTTKVTEAIKKIQDWAKEHPGLFSGITKVTGGLGALMLVVGPMLISLPLLANGIKMVGVAAKVAMGPVGILIAGLGFISERVISATKDFKSFTDLIDKEAEAQGEKVSWLSRTWQGLQAVTSKYVQGIDTTKLAQQAYNAQLDKTTKLSTDWKGALEGVVGWMGKVNEAYGAQKVAMRPVVELTETAVGETSKLAIQVNAWKTEVISLTTILEGAKITLAGFYEEAIPKARDLSDVLALAPEKMEELAFETKETTKKVTTAWDTMADGLQTKWSTTISDAILPDAWKMEGALGEMFNAILEQFSDMVGQMASKWLTGFITKFVSSTKDAATDVVGSVKDVATSALDLAKGFSPGGMIATAVGTAVGTFLGSILGPKGAGERDTQLIKDNTWMTQARLENVVLNLDAIKWSGWNNEERIQNIMLTGWSFWERLKGLPSLLDVGHNLLRDIIGELRGIGLNMNALVGIMKKVTGFSTEGIAWEPQLAMVAEQGPEVILNLDRMQQGQVPGQGNTVVFNIQSWDAVDTERWLRDKGLSLIEEGLRQNVGGNTEKIEESLQIYRK